MKKLLIIMIFSSCAYWTPTHNAVLRSRASDKLSTCINLWKFPESECLKQSHQFCEDNGLEPSCGVDGLWGKVR